MKTIMKQTRFYLKRYRWASMAYFVVLILDVWYEGKFDRWQIYPIIFGGFVLCIVGWHFIYKYVAPKLHEKKII